MSFSDGDIERQLEERGIGCGFAAAKRVACEFKRTLALATSQQQPQIDLNRILAIIEAPILLPGAGSRKWHCDSNAAAGSGLSQRFMHGAITFCLAAWGVVSPTSRQRPSFGSRLSSSLSERISTGTTTGIGAVETLLYAMTQRVRYGDPPC